MAGDAPRAALVVGGGTGIGYASARRLGLRGFAVALAGRRAAVLAEACERLRGDVPGIETAAIPGDGGLEEQARAMVEGTVAAFGRLDVCVNCAGMYEPVHFLELTTASWQRTMSTTLDAQLYVAVAAARQMAANGGGRIVVVSSISSPLSEPDAAAYSAAKAAVSSLVRSMAVDLAAHGIVANAVAPGWVATEMTEAFVSTKTAEELERINVLRRVGQPDEVASMIEYVAVDAPTYLTGSVIYVDGGQTAMALLP